MSGIRRHVLLIVLVLAASLDSFAAQAPTIHGRVLDSRTNEPIAKALVSIRDRKIETTTNENGEFSLEAVQPGDIELYVTTVGYGLVRKKIEISAGIPIDIEILLGPDVLRHSDETTVTADPYLTTEPATISDHTLTESEMKNLTSVLVDHASATIAICASLAPTKFGAPFSAIRRSRSQR